MTILADFLKPIALTLVVSFGTWGLATYRDQATTKIEIQTIKDNLAKEETAQKEHEKVHAADSHLIYNLEGKVDGISVQIDALRQDLRLTHQQK